jgi:dipeptidyl aminopeptidase/acylaminoacyl peptidase
MKPNTVFLEKRRLLGGLMIAFALAAAGCSDGFSLPTGEDTQNNSGTNGEDTALVPESPLLRYLEPKSGQIAFIGSDGNLHLTNQAGSNLIDLTADASADDVTGDLSIYQFPVWSPDGKQVAFMQLQANNTSGEVSESRILVTDANGKQDPVELFDSSVERPVFLDWSPDGRYLTFLAQASYRNTLALYLLDAEAGGEPQVVDVGSPLFYAWNPAGDQIMIHDEQALETFGGRLAVLSNFAGQVIEDDLAYTPFGFQSPAWSPDGDQALVAIQAENANRLALIDQSGEITHELAEFELTATFSWSPDGEHIAYVVSDDATAGNRVGSLNVVGVEDEDFHLTSEQDNVFAYFWSPDGSKIAYFTPSTLQDEATGEDVQYFRLRVLDIQDGESIELAAFVPTQDMARLLQFFDLYQPSTTIWSPDSENLVISAIFQEDNAAIVVLDASGQFDPRPVGSGFVAYWSPD